MLVHSWEKRLLIIFKEKAQTIPNYILMQCELGEVAPTRCRTLGLPLESHQTLKFKILNSHFFIMFEVFSGSCELAIGSQDDLSFFKSIFLPAEEGECNIEDVGFFYNSEEKLVLVSDRTRGLFLFQVTKMLYPPTS